jgi:hypothetical protein
MTGDPFRGRNGIGPSPCNAGIFDKIRAFWILHLAAGNFSFGNRSNKTNFDSLAASFELVRRIEHTFLLLY